MKLRVLFAASMLLGMQRAAAAGDTLGVFFRYNESELPAEMIRRLDSALIDGPLNRNGRLLIIGHTDALGTEGYNLQLSRQRAQTVKTFLTGSGFRPSDIQLITGLGEQNAGVATDPDSRPGDRRVDVVFLGDRQRRRTALPPPDTAAKRFVPPPADRPGQRRDSATTLNELVAGESLVLKNVYFYPGRHTVRPESYPALEALFGALIAQPKMAIRIEGHVCCISAGAADALDEETMRLELSLNRALAIRSMLIDRGIDAARIETTGFGRRFPIVALERNEDEANQNRRVEIRVLKR